MPWDAGRGGTSEQEQLPCPRCDSTNTKFCYYNNYNLSQPRHLCKSCRRYWTQGGTLRDIPVGGASRKRSRTTTTPLFNGTFTSLLTTHPQPQPGPAFQHMPFGFGNVMMMGHFHDSFSCPDLAISTPGFNALK